MKSAQDLRKLLDEINRKSYPAYKGTKGSYRFENYILQIDHVQGDPFASPSKVSISIDGRQAGFPKQLFDRKFKRIALQDYLTRVFYQKIERFHFKAKGSGKSGLLSVSRCGQEILERTACTVDPASGNVLVHMEVGFPANGRTINSGELIKIFFEFLPECVQESFFYPRADKKRIEQVIFLAEDQQMIREEIRKRRLSAFVANGSILPRESGISSRPMKNGIPFRSPKELEVEMDLPHRGKITGMGIPCGITLIVGGGYHGKSTLLNALELGVYNHIAGDGREYVISDDTAVKLRAEDGRSIKKTDISMFINNLPNKKNTEAFYTEDASGSTSQAANVVEAVEAGSSLFLIDEDTSATNFMIRDELMQRVVAREKEPITPFIDRVRELYEKEGVSSIIVAGSSGSYFHIADTVIQMEQYEPAEITAFAKQEAAAFPLPVSEGKREMKHPCEQRSAQKNKSFGDRGKVKIKAMGKDGIQINRETIELRYIEQIVDGEQTNTLGYLVKYAEQNLFDGKKTIRQVVDAMEQKMERDGLASVAESSYLPVNFAMPRRQEIFACLNRYRGLRL
nr:ABC-ATPase domain-containing protein [uncultured Faecalimonas sp.]